MSKLLIALCLTLSMAAQAAEPEAAPGKAVRIAYSVVADGRRVDAAVEAEPVRFVLGEGAMMPGLEAALVGMRPGEEKTFAVAPAEAYGEIDPDAIKRVPSTALPPGLKPEPGMAMEVRASGGQVMRAVIRAVEGDRVVLDFNHPLAGKALTFTVRLLSVAEAEAAESPRPRATQPARSYPELLKITPAGVVYVPRTGDPADPDEVAALFGTIRADADNALLQCGTLIVGIETQGDILKVHGVLNGTTRTALEALVEPSADKIGEEKVLAALLARYAGAETRYRRSLGCGLLLTPLAGDSEALNGQLRRDICPRVERLTACLEDLRVADRRIREQAGSGGLRLYSGARWDSPANHLDQLAGAGR